jgi:hypothetical protein
MIPPVVVGGGGPVNVVVVGVMIPPVVVGGGGPANVVVTKVDAVLLVGVILVTDDETVTSVMGVCDLSLPQETTYTIDAVTIRTTAGGPPPFATLRADARIDTTETPRKRRYGQADIPTAAHEISREEQKFDFASREIPPQQSQGAM